MFQRNYIKGLLSIVLGIWLWSMPATFGYSQRVIDWNDGICGLILFLFGATWMLHPKQYVAWLMCLLGLWLQAAPLVFWYPDPAAYLNDTLIGVLVVVISVIIPNKPYGLERANHIPLGWSYNPSAWIQRIPIIALALFCWLISRYLAAYQLGYTDILWDPVFGDGTFRVITSDISKAWPISDAGLGAFSYTIEALMGCQGDTKRWCSSPWAVILFGILVVPLGVVSIVLIILQPVVVSAWCFLCLATALFMLIMISFTIDEVVACVQYLYQVKQMRRPMWKIFWCGGRPLGESSKIRLKPHPLSALFWGVTIPWNIALSALLGVWLMVAPYVLETAPPLSSSDFITGAIVISFSFVAFSETTRTARFFNVLFGMWLFAAPWILPGATLAGHWNEHAVGLALILLAYPKGLILEKYGAYTKKIG